MGTGADWADVISALDERFYCVAPDLPGHGSSLGLPPEATPSRERHGRSWICSIVLALAVQRSPATRWRAPRALPRAAPSGRVLRALSGIHLAGDRGRRRARDAPPLGRGEGGAIGVRRPLELPARLVTATPLRVAPRPRCCYEKPSRRDCNDPGELAKSLRGMGTGSQPSLWGELAELEAPALAVAGELDKKYAAISTRMASITPRIRAAIVPGAGHNVRLETPETYRPSNALSGCPPGAKMLSAARRSQGGVLRSEGLLKARAC